MPSLKASATRSGSDPYRERHLAILRHVGLYRLTLRRAVCQAVAGVPDESTAGTSLTRLALDGLLVAHDRKNKEALPGGLVYYTLSAKGAKDARVPDDRAKPLKEAAIRDHLAVLWFCCLGAERRYRLEPTEMRELFGSDAPHHNTPHCLAQESVGYRVYRLYATDADPTTTLRQVRKHVEEASGNPTLRAWVKTREYGFAVLAETAEKCQQLRALLGEGKGGERPLAEEAHVLVEVSPSPATVKEAYTALAGKGTP